MNWKSMDIIKNRNNKKGYFLPINSKEEEIEHKLLRYFNLMETFINHKFLANMSLLLLNL